MLKPPYKKYKDLHIYSVKKTDISVDDPDLIGIWHEEDTTLIFFHKQKEQFIKENSLNLIFYTCVPYVEWEAGKFIKSFNIGKFSIVPVWEAKDKINTKPNLKQHKRFFANAQNDACFSHSEGAQATEESLTSSLALYNNSILIDPSVVFGTGFHPTTRMILEEFYKLVSTSNNAHLKSAIDLGCGSGILSILASKLGFNNIVAIDNNNLSYEVACKNRDINLCNIEIFLGDIFNFLPYKYDVVFANLYYHLLEDLFEKEEFWHSKYYFVSGFIKQMEKRILECIGEKAVVLKRKENENWVMLLLKNRW